MKEVKTKESIEKIAEKMLLWKIGKRKELPCSPIKDKELFAEAIQYLVDKKYLVKKTEKSKTIYSVPDNKLAYLESLQKL